MKIMKFKTGLTYSVGRSSVLKFVLKGVLDDPLASSYRGSFVIYLYLGECFTIPFVWYGDVDERLWQEAWSVVRDVINVPHVNPPSAFRIGVVTDLIRRLRTV